MVTCSSICLCMRCYEWQLFSPIMHLLHPEKPRVIPPGDWLCLLICKDLHNWRMCSEHCSNIILTGLQDLSYINIYTQCQKITFISLLQKTYTFPYKLKIFSKNKFAGRTHPCSILNQTMNEPCCFFTYGSFKQNLNCYLMVTVFNLQTNFTWLCRHVVTKMVFFVRTHGNLGTLVRNKILAESLNV